MSKGLIKVKIVMTLWVPAMLVLGLLSLLPVLQQPVRAQSYENLQTNPGFESNWTGWAVNGTAVVDAAAAHSGSKSVKIAADSQNEWNVVASGTRMKAVEGQSFRLDAYIKDTITASSLMIGLRFSNASDGTVQYLWHPAGHSSNWTRQGDTFTAPRHATNVQIYIWMPSDTVGTAWIDDLQLSTDNLASDPGFELNNGSWSGPAIVYDASTARTGSKSAKMAGSSHTFNVISTTAALPSNENQEFILKAFSKDTITSGTFQMGLRYIDATGTSISYDWVTAANSSNWHQTVLKARTPAGTKSIQIYFWISQHATGSVWIDDVVWQSQNVLINPGFENNYDGWSSLEGVIDTTTYYEGSKSFKLVGNSTQPWNVVADSNLISAKAGESMKLQVVMKSTLTAGSLKMGIRYIKPDGVTSISFAWYDAALLSSWKMNEEVFVAPADTAYVQAYFLLSQDAVGSVWIDNTILSKEPDPFRFQLTEKHKWSNETTVNANFDITLAKGQLSDYKVKIERFDFGGTVPVFTKEYTSPTASFTDSFALSGLPLGYSTYKAHLIRKTDGVTMFTGIQELQKVDPYTYPVLPNTASVTFSPNKAELLNGNSFITRNLYNVGPANFAAVKARGFNTVLVAERDGYTMTQVLDMAQAAGLKASAALFLDTSNVDLTYIENTVNTVKNHPALLYWVLNDEPDGNGVSPANMQAAYNLVKSLDTSHPVTFVLTFKKSITNGTYNGATDMINSDPYPVPYFDLDTYVRNRVDAAAATGKPVAATIQSFGRYAAWPREPLPEETRAMTYLAINHGAKSTAFYSLVDVDGLGGYLWNMPVDSPQLWALYKVLNQELELLKDVIGAAGVPQTITASSADIDLKLRSYNGADYLFAVNKTNKEVTATFSGGGLLNKASADVVYENRAKTISGSAFNDTFSPYMVHIYKLQADYLPISPTVVTQFDGFRQFNSSGSVDIKLSLSMATPVQKLMIQNRPDTATNLNIKHVQVFVGSTDDGSTFDTLVFNGVVPGTNTANEVRAIDITDVTKRYFKIVVTENFWGTLNNTVDRDKIHVGYINFQ
ncbi:carbohydrate binding domain-containing protein [Paenibacillus eucommiae]|uniref:Beta-galactosidase n=1 Tax=Paenibacillus eucommiae TaxID=1355755 RepID=A0ABS4J690_9BACL|nr:carbohydrate binding domain-containing protein [Paenibacillus eucommiae]MBP1995376.1 hypothetical protein [Paenibacillus eucommiae]